VVYSKNKVDTSSYDKKLEFIQKKIKNAFSTVKEELTEHLDSINENTNEISANYDYLCELDSKINKLNEKLDNIQMMFQSFMQQKAVTVVKPDLSMDEQKVFLLLYTSENTLLSHKQISNKLEVPIIVTVSNINNLISKGIPIVEKKIDGDSYYELDRQFRDIQAKEGVVEISPSIIEST